MSEQKIVIANCLDYLRAMPDESVDVCVTSPPYWALRDYGSEPVIWGDDPSCNHDWIEHKQSARGGANPNANVSANKDDMANNRGHPTVSNYCSKCGAWKGQLGLEPSPYEYVDHLMLIFNEVNRVLKSTGACWVNIGDTYATTSGFVGDTKGVDRSLNSLLSAKKIREGLDRKAFPQKTLCQIPSRFAIAMTDNGWILRNSIVWRKSNPMPTSAVDRFTVDYEMFYFFVKNPKYYFKQQFEPMVQPEAKARFGHQKVGNVNPLYSGKMYDAKNLNGKRNVRTTWFIDSEFDASVNTSKWKDDEIESKIRQGMNQNRGNGSVEKRYSLPEKIVLVRFLRECSTPEDIVKDTDLSLTTVEHWFRSDEGFSYPAKEDWIRIRDRLDDGTDTFKEIDEGLTKVTIESDDIMKNSDGLLKNVRTTWDIPTHGSSIEHCAMFPKELIRRPIDACCPPNGVVLDPFCGSGTVLEYCFENDIDAIGIEINPDYEPFIKARARKGQMRLI